MSVRGQKFLVADLDWRLPICVVGSPSPNSVEVVLLHGGETGEDGESSENSFLERDHNSYF